VIPVEAQWLVRWRFRLELNGDLPRLVVLSVGPLSAGSAVPLSRSFTSELIVSVSVFFASVRVPLPVLLSLFVIPFAVGVGYPRCDDDGCCGGGRQAESADSSDCRPSPAG
jgi:hypothetical protein